MPQEHVQNPFISILKELLAVPLPSGREERLAGLVRARLRTLGYSPETDPAGNVFVRVPGKLGGPLMVVAAHMDEIGMVVARIDDDGALRVVPSGGLTPAKLGESPVEIVGDNRTLIGILSMGSGHGGVPADRAPGWDDVKIITGLTPGQLKDAGVRPGSTAVPVEQYRGPFLFGDPSDPLVAAWTFDDRAGVVTLLRLLGELKEGNITPRVPLIVAFTVHEEGGCHGAKVLAQRESPGVFLAIDGCPMPQSAGLKLDGRPGAWSKDKKIHYDQRLVIALSRAAEEAGTGLQVAVYQEAASDASAVYEVGAAPRVAILGHVRENSHGYEVARLSVFDNLLAVLLSFLGSWRPDTNENL